MAVRGVPSRRFDTGAKKEENTMAKEEEKKSIKEKLFELWLWSVAITFTLLGLVTAMLWIIGIAVFFMRLCNV